MERPKLNELESRTPVWLMLAAFMEQRLSNLRSQNDSMALDPLRTAELRGRISEIKAMLSMDGRE